MQGLASGSVDAVIADPPYGMAYRSHLTRRGGRFTARFPNIAGDRGFDAVFTTRWLGEARRVLRDDSHIYVFCSDHHLGAFRQAVAACGFRLKRTLVWLKPHWTAGDLRGDYGHQTEFLVFAHKGRRALNGKREGNVLAYPRVPPARMCHPTEKPVELLQHLIRKSTDCGDTVLDPFAGSGTTGVAALAEGRSFIGIELDPAFGVLAKERLAASS